jgi:hypothetical protein
MFYRDIAYVAVVMYICCKHMFQMFHLFQTYVTTSVACYECFH